jgi:hypothetical protein
MPRARKNRDALVRRWKVALANAGLKQAEWSARYDWTENHVGQVVAGKRVSVHVMQRVMPFIEEQERLIARRAIKDPTSTAAA